MSTNGLGPGGLGFPEWGYRCSSCCQRRHREDQVHETKGRNRMVVFQSLDHLYFFKILFVDYTTICIDMTWYDRIDRMYEYSMCTVLFFFGTNPKQPLTLGWCKKPGVKRMVVQLPTPTGGGRISDPSTVYMSQFLSRTKTVLFDVLNPQHRFGPFCIFWFR